MNETCVVNASLGDAPGTFTVTIADGTVAGIESSGSSPRAGRTLDARGGALLPGLWDHHVHLLSAAARVRSIDVAGVQTLDHLAQVIATARTPPRGGWLRLVGYDDAAIGLLDSDVLDRIAPDAPPLRVQHRSGHHWVLNSSARDDLQRRGGSVPDDGVLWDDDRALRPLGTERSARDLGRVAHAWAQRGFVGATDMTATTTADTAEWMIQHVGTALTLDLFGAQNPAATASTLDGVKLVLDTREPLSWQGLSSAILAARPLPVAIHAVTAESLTLAAAVLADLPGAVGDRVEHAFLTPAGLPARHAAAGWGFAVGVQPGFIHTHGARLLQRLTAQERAEYQPLREWQEAGVTLLGGTDAPYATSDPWAAMAAAVSRRSSTGDVLGVDQGVTPEAAFALFTPAGLTGDAAVPTITVGQTADLCLIDRPWSSARRDLARTRVRATLRAGRVCAGERTD